MAYFVLKDGDGYIAIDQNSGGYPYTTEINHAHVFKTASSALEYNKHCNYEICQLEYKVIKRGDLNIAQEKIIKAEEKLKEMNDTLKGLGEL